MNKKKEALKKIENLEKEIINLKKIINEPDDLFSSIKSYEDVVMYIKENNLSFLYIETFNKKLLAFCMIQNILTVFNNGWKPNWKDNNERKYYPWFEYKSSGGWSLLV